MQFFCNVPIQRTYPGGSGRTVRMTKILTPEGAALCKNYEENAKPEKRKEFKSTQNGGEAKKSAFDFSAIRSALIDLQELGMQKGVLEHVPERYKSIVPQNVSDKYDRAEQCAEVSITDRVYEGDNEGNFSFSKD